MTYRQRIAADRCLAVPLALVFNVAARLLGAVLNRDHSIHPERVRCILVAKLVGMGSAIQATPLLRALRQHFPGAQITFVTLVSNRDLVERMEEVDRVLCLDDRSVLRMAWSTSCLVVRMIRLQAEMYFDLELYSSFASLIALWSLARNRIGFCRQSTRFKRGIYTHLIYFNTHRAIRLVYLQMARAVGARNIASDELGKLRVDATDWVSVSRKLGERSGGWDEDTSYVVINPNASELLLERRWPAAYVQDTVEALAAKGCRIVVIGSTSEQAYVRDLVKGLSPVAKRLVVDTSGTFSIGELLAAIDHARCVVTNDTGPMHMAISLRKPTVCLFGPVSPDHYGYPGVHVETLYAPVYCSPCVHEIESPPCCGQNYCMQRILPHVVVTAVERVLGSGPRSGVSAGQLALVAESEDGAPLGIVVTNGCLSARRSG